MKSNAYIYSGYSLRTQLSNFSFLNKIVILSLYPLSFLLIAFRYLFLPEKYFYDSNHILRLMGSVNSISSQGASFNNAAILFKSINFMNLDTLFQWSICLGVVMNMIILFYFMKTGIKKGTDLIITYCFLGLLNIYVFNLSKEIIQFTVFMLIYCITKAKINNTQKCVFICFMFYLESIFFRSYYILIGAFFIAIYFIMSKNILKTKDGKISWLKLILLAVVGLYLFFEICSLIMPNEYSELVEIRNKLTIRRIGDDSAQTLILNLFNIGNNNFVYLLNYFINFLRILFPVELLVKGVYYWIFCFFQVICTYKLIRCIRYYSYLPKNSKISLYVMVAYYIVCVFFEPDFGSFIRHEAATAPILYELIIVNSTLSKDKNITCSANS